MPLRKVWRNIKKQFFRCLPCLSPKSTTAVDDLDILTGNSLPIWHPRPETPQGYSSPSSAIVDNNTSPSTEDQCQSEVVSKLPKKFWEDVWPNQPRYRPYYFEILEAVDETEEDVDNDSFSNSKHLENISAHHESGDSTERFEQISHCSHPEQSESPFRTFPSQPRIVRFHHQVRLVVGDSPLIIPLGLPFEIFYDEYNQGDDEEVKPKEDEEVQNEESDEEDILEEEALDSDDAKDDPEDEDEFDDEDEETIQEKVVDEENKETQKDDNNEEEQNDGEDPVKANQEESEDSKEQLEKEPEESPEIVEEDDQIPPPANPARTSERFRTGLQNLANMYCFDEDDQFSWASGPRN